MHSLPFLLYSVTKIISFSVCLYANFSDEVCTGSAKKARLKKKEEGSHTIWKSLTATISSLCYAAYLVVGPILVVTLPVIIGSVTGNSSLLNEKYPFLPLMVYSVFCALGNVYAFTTMYLKYAIL